MNELLGKIQELYNLIVGQKAALDTEATRLAGVKNSLDEQSVVLEAKAKELAGREAKVKAIEDCAKLNEDTKRLNEDTKARITELKNEESAFIKYREQEVATIGAIRKSLEESTCAVNAKEKELNDGLKKLAEDKLNYKEQVIKALAQNISDKAV